MKTNYLKEKIYSLGTGNLNDLIIHLSESSTDARQLILEWFKEQEEKSNKKETGNIDTRLNDELLQAYWEIAQQIIAELNEYYEDGRISEYYLDKLLEFKQDEVFNCISSIFNLIYNEELSTKAKFKFIDSAFTEYWKKNSGFETMIMIMVSEICKTPLEWEYLITKLGENAGDWEKKLKKKFKKEQSKKV